MTSSEPASSGATAQAESVLPLRARVAEAMLVERHEADPAGGQVAFFGKLRLPSGEAFAKLEQRLGELAYTPLLRELEEGNHIVVAIKGAAASTTPNRTWLSIGLFAATFVTTVIAGTLLSPALSGRPASFEATSILTNGLPFALTLLGMLLAHEMGHFIAGKIHKLPVSLPYFIPMPIGLGTLGAFVQFRGAPRDRRALFDVGLAGPLAGLLIALPLYAVGLAMAQVADTPAPPTRSLLMDGIIALVRPDAMSKGIFFNPVLFAARVGLMLTMLNLLPVGQFDGSHIMYAALGAKWYRWLSMAVLVLMVLFAVIGSREWLLWAMFGWFGRGRHLPARDDMTELNLPRMLMFIGTVVLFLSLFSVRPF
jgi:membrane-associated protease RseP (regulator of RpoE activity)